MADGKPNGGAARANKTEDDITAEALQRFAQTPDPRLRQIMLEPRSSTCTPSSRRSS